MRDNIHDQVSMRHYVLSVSTLGLGYDGDGRKVSVLIPAGAEVIAIDPVPSVRPDNPTTLVRIVWKARVVAVFLTDLQERAKVVRRPVQN